ncbi:hypothetical protein L226DRAFT_566775 [Lentinus tigrinus ALCF2SS1-7]|uniref:ATPase inhibitor, mitochondrial n=1 Tax=Lentinus tigrinus ALCF2SS1-6 TaxID=1328759 RepID=A0A5C2SRN2_9APHY|nr:hypothetical protein L227DRAFT_606440 [Lentinus tigrinus ALCF2SS1-6]RPD80262.1 hypothetical protein L226DRAFT_566775 [Lentinus tigrinus ALCF2SS1-7]
MSSGKTAEDSSWKTREQASENQYARSKEQEQLKAIKDELANKQPAKSELDKDFEGGFGGQEDLEDRYATTLGEH